MTIIFKKYQKSSYIRAVAQLLWMFVPIWQYSFSLEDFKTSSLAMALSVLHFPVSAGQASWIFATRKSIFGELCMFR